MMGHWDTRRRSLSDLADFIATEDDSVGFPLNLSIIAENEGLTFNLGDYDNYFDGLLEYEDGRFHIFLNNHGIYSIDTPRIRFSFAHELGHYFIDEHRQVLESGKSLHIPSRYLLEQKDPIEKEADFFASCLLMPNSVFRRKCSGKFSYHMVSELQSFFGASLSATLVRYMQIGSYPICVVLVKDGVIKHKWFSDEFPFKNLKTDFRGIVPKETCAGEYPNSLYSQTETVDVSAWFRSYENLTGLTLNEHCIYPSAGFDTISILWFD